MELVLPTPPKPIVVIESPYAGDVEKHVLYARLAMRDCLHRGEAPYASHLLYTQLNVLNDDIAEQRELGMQAGFAYHRVSDYSVVYRDFGISDGMRAGVVIAMYHGRPVKYRNLPEEVMKTHGLVATEAQES